MRTAHTDKNLSTPIMHLSLTPFSLPNTHHGDKTVQHSRDKKQKRFILRENAFGGAALDRSIKTGHLCNQSGSKAVLSRDPIATAVNLANRWRTVNNCKSLQRLTQFPNFSFFFFFALPATC